MASSLLNMATLAWLGVSTWQDLRTRQVSNWLTVPPLFAVVIWRVVQRDTVPLFLLVALVSFNAVQFRPLVCITLYSLICVVVAIATAQPLVPVAWATAYMALYLNMAGGADAKLVLTLLTLFPDARLAGLMLAALFGFSIVALIARGQARLVWSSPFHPPTPQELEEEGVPLVGVLTAAFVAWRLVF